jgi:hypothetical protein
VRWSSRCIFPQSAIRNPQSAIRNPKMPRLQSFAEFWPYYVREHSRPATRVVHFCGTTLALVLLMGALAMGAWWWMAAVPLCGYAFAWISHLAIERNRPATFTYPLWSLLADFKMWGLMATGRMNAEITRIKQAGEWK